MTKRPIRPHKGGRICRAPEARMTPQERERLDAVLRHYGAKYVNWLIDHVEADYAEITGVSKMNSEELANLAIKNLHGMIDRKHVQMAILNACLESPSLIPQKTIDEATARILRGISVAEKIKSLEPPALFDDKISDEEADMLDAEQEEEAAEFLGIKTAKPKRSKRTSK